MLLFCINFSHKQKTGPDNTKVQQLQQQHTGNSSVKNPNRSVPGECGRYIMQNRVQYSGNYTGGKKRERRKAKVINTVVWMNAHQCSGNIYINAIKWFLSTSKGISVRVRKSRGMFIMIVLCHPNIEG